AWSRNQTSWRLWLPASIPLAVGMLLKGPLIFLVYYVLVVAILHFERHKKELASPWHPIAFAVALTPFLVWSLLFLDKTSNAAHSAWEVHSGAVTWAHEIMLRMRFGEISFGKWLSRVAGSFAQFLPWLLFFPLLWNKRLFDGSEEKTLTFARAAKFAVPAVLILIDAMPATKARYSAPLIPIVVLAFGAITARIAVGGKMESSLKKIVYCAIATTACVSVFLLLSLLWLKFASMGALGIDESKISAFLAALKGMQLAPPLLSVVVAVAAFIIYKKHSNSLNGTPELILSATFAMVVGICVFLVFIHPLTKATRHYARNTANYIDAFTSEGAVVCGVGYVGEEPFTAHLKSSWVMVDKVEDLKTCPEVFVLSEDSLEDLERFSKKNALREVERKKIVYKKDHFYQLVRFEQEVCKVAEPQ
ncbi:MAG: hypothetical protein KAG97_09865, partial [Victivallales bacterium]|nr:hypothetical protein [Victivallales bacterium]